MGSSHEVAHDAPDYPGVIWITAPCEGNQSHRHGAGLNRAVEQQVVDAGPLPAPGERPGLFPPGAAAEVAPNCLAVSSTLASPGTALRGPARL